MESPMYPQPPTGHVDPMGGQAIHPFAMPGMRTFEAPQSDGPDDFSDLPDEIAETFAKHETGSLISFTPERLLESGETELATEYQGYRPSTEEIGTKFGPGKWRYKFSYRPKNWKRGDKKLHKVTPWFVLSDEAYRLKHQAYLAESENRHLEALRLRGEQKRAILGAGGEMTMGNPLEMLGAVAGIVRTLAPIQAPAPASNGMESLLPILLKIQADQQAQAQQANQQNMALFMGMMQNMAQANQQMMQAVMQIGSEQTRMMVTQLGNQNGGMATDMMKQFSDFVMSGLNIRRTIHTELANEDGENEMDIQAIETKEEKSLLATIMEAIPVVLQNLPILQAIPAIARPGIVANKVAEVSGPQGTQAYQALKNDSQMRVRAIAGFVKDFGPEQVEEVLEAMGIKYTPDEMKEGMKHGMAARAHAEQMAQAPQEDFPPAPESQNPEHEQD